MMSAQKDLKVAHSLTELRELTKYRLKHTHKRKPTPNPGDSAACVWLVDTLNDGHEAAFPYNSAKSPS